MFERTLSVLADCTMPRPFTIVLSILIKASRSPIMACLSLLLVAGLELVDPQV